MTQQWATVSRQPQDTPISFVAGIIWSARWDYLLFCHHHLNTFKCQPFSIIWRQALSLAWLPGIALHGLHWLGLWLLWQPPFLESLLWDGLWFQCWYWSAMGSRGIPFQFKLLQLARLILHLGSGCGREISGVDPHSDAHLGNKTIHSLQDIYHSTQAKVYVSSKCVPFHSNDFICWVGVDIILFVRRRTLLLNTTFGHYLPRWPHLIRINNSYLHWTLQLCKPMVSSATSTSQGSHFHSHGMLLHIQEFLF